MARLPTPSSLDRADACPASCVLPQVNESTTDAELGAAIHDYLRDVPILGMDAALAKVPEEHVARASAIDVSMLPACDPDGYASEVAFAYSLDTGECRELGRGLDRSYPDLPGRWIYGTADSVGLTDEAVLIHDYKTGQGFVPRARDNRQVRTYALMACRAYGRREAIVVITRIMPDGGSWSDRADLDAVDIDSTELDLQEIVEKVAAADAVLASGTVPEVTIGRQCDYCPAFCYCPAQTALVRALAEPDEILPLVPPEVLTPETAAAAYRRLVQVQAVCEVVKRSIDTFARLAPIDLGDGMVYGPRVERRESIDGDAAVPILREELGLFAEHSFETKVTKTSIERAVRKAIQANPGGGTKITQAKEHLLERLRQAGVVKMETVTRMTQHRGAAA